MLKSRKQKSIVTLVVATALSCGMAIAVSTQNPTVAKAEGFDSFTMLGAQLRVDDAGVRFVMEMGADTYEQYSKDDAYTSGVLVIPEWLLGDNDLEVGSLDYEDIVFDTTYEAYAKDGGYRFNAVLKNIPNTEYDTKLCARGYIKDSEGEVVAYTDTITRNVSYVASEYVDDYAEETVEYQNVESYIVKAYNSLTGENATCFEDLQMELTMNDINTIMADNENGEFSNEVKTVLEELFPITYSVSEGTENVSIDEETGVVTANAKGKATVEASTCCGVLTSSYDFTVMDNVLWNIGSGYKNGEYKEYNEPSDFYADQMMMYAKANINAKKYITTGEQVEYVAEKAGKTDVLSYSTNKSNIFFQPHLEYTKEEIKMLLDFGYDRLTIPVYVEVDSSNIPEKYAVGLDRMDVWTPNYRITNTNEEYCGYPGYNKKISHYSQRSLMFNQWNQLSISLQLVYDNYEEFTKYDLTATGARSWTLFSVQLIEQGGSEVDFAKTFYFGNIVLEKNNFVAESEKGYAIDITNPEVLDKIAFVKQNVKAAASTDFYVGMYGQTSITEGTVAGKTGTFLTLTNIDYSRGGICDHLSSEKVRGNDTQSLFFGSIMTKDELVALQQAGYTKLSFTMNHQTKDTVYSKTQTGVTKPYITSNDGAVLTGHQTTMAKTEQWYKFSISIETLINQYDEYFTDTKPYCYFDPETTSKYTDTTKYHHSIFQAASLQTTGAIVTLYIADMMFVK